MAVGRYAKVDKKTREVLNIELCDSDAMPPLPKGCLWMPDDDPTAPAIIGGTHDKTAGVFVPPLPPSPPPVPPPADAVTKALLIDKGVMTDAEWQTKRTELGG